MRLTILSISIFLLAFSCASKKDIPEATTFQNAFEVSDSTVIAKLREPGCFGKCATYELTVLANGLCMYNAKQHTKLDAGMYHGKIDTSKVNELHKIGDIIGFKDYQNVYTNRYIADKPSVFISLFIPEHDSIKMVERVIDYPQEILILENKLKEIVKHTEWTRTSSNKQ